MIGDTPVLLTLFYVKPDDVNMANVFVYSGVAIAAGAPANRRTLNLARISFFYLSQTVSYWIIYEYKTTIYKQIQSEWAAFFSIWQSVQNSV